MADLLPCPFCGHEPKQEEDYVDIGGGDTQKVFRIYCDQCPVKPSIAVRGQAGYSVSTKRTNEEAAKEVYRIWQKRIIE